jgi:hypothetical protein
VGLAETSCSSRRSFLSFMERSEAGALFLLGKSGLTVVRQPSVEEDYAAELNARRGN